MRITMCAVAAALLGSAGLASAAKVQATDFAQGVENQVVTRGGIDVLLNSFSNGVIYEDGGPGGLGVSGGGANNEVGSVDRLTFQFSQEVNIRRLEIQKLFAVGYMGDLYNEGVKITTDNGTFHFHASDVPQGTVAHNQSFGGSLLALSEPDADGHWRLYGDMLFGGPITFITLEADPEGIWPYFADFTFSSMNFVPANRIPAPSAVAVLGLGGLAVARRRR